LGLAAGVLIALLAMFLLERLDKTLRDPAEVEALLGLAVLGMIPSSRAFARNASVSPLEATPEAEAFRLLRTQLRYFNVDTEVRSLLVTSGDVGDGKSIVAWNLARTAAALSPTSRVLLIDGDLRRPRIATLAGESASPGLSELLTHGLSVQDVVRRSRLGATEQGQAACDLFIITAGALAPNPSELMQSEKLRVVLQELQQHFDFVIVDAPPSAVVSDAIPVMSQVSGVLVVVRLRHSRRNSLRRLREQVSRLPAPCLGVIINDVRRSDGGYARYYRDEDRGGKRVARHASLEQPARTTRVVTPESDADAATVEPR
jgi:capsular exopolysaccharide synthesis family protein